MSRKSRGKVKPHKKGKQKTRHLTTPPSPDAAKGDVVAPRASLNGGEANVAPPAPLDASKATIPIRRRPKIKWLIGTAIGLFVAICAYGSWMEYRRQAKANQEQAIAAQEENDRRAGRLSPKAEIVELLPTLKSAEIKPWVKPMHPESLFIKVVNDRGERLDFVTFDDIHALCSVNPRVRLKNTGNEMIESVQIHVEELSVMPLNPKGGLFFVRDPRDQTQKGLIRTKPNLDPTQTENCSFAEKFKPGDEAEVPIWRPLIRAIGRAQVLIDRGDHAVAKAPQEFGNLELVLPGWSGKYHGAFKVRLSVRAVGASASDGTDKGPVPLGFIWSARGFKEEDCKRILDRPMAALKVGL